MKLLLGCTAILLTLPIWFYLLYKILVAVNATDLMFFLFWVYVPATVILNILSRISEE